MTPILRLSRNAELLGLVPALCGFTPRQSVVIVPFRGKRTHASVRVDLPDAESDLESFRHAVLSFVERIGSITGAAIVIYTDERPTSTPDGLLLPSTIVSDALIDACEELDLRVVEALCVTPAGWGDYLSDDHELHPLDDIVAPDIPDLGDVSGDQHAGAQLPTSDLAERERVGRAMREIEDAFTCTAFDENAIAPKLQEAAAAIGDVVGFAEKHLDAPEAMSPIACASLLHLLLAPLTRDAMLIQWATDDAFGALALETQLSFVEEGDMTPDAVGQVFLGKGAVPDPDRLLAALALVRTAASRAPRGARPGALVAAGWLSWALGRSTHTIEYAHQALEIDPSHSMATLLVRMAQAGFMPSWLPGLAEHALADQP